MITAHSLTFYAHILAGSLALLLFWVPMVTRKGALNHRRFGRYYRTTMYTVAISGALMSLLVLSAPQAVKPEIYARNANLDPADVTAYLRTFWGLLLYLALLTYLSIRHAMMALEDRQRHSFRRPLHLGLITLLMVGGVAVLVNGIVQEHILSMIFGPLGIFLGTGQLRYSLAREVAPKAWLAEHLGGFIGSGIAAYTAFLAFGGRVILADAGAFQLLFWVAPGAVGTALIVWMTRRHVSPNVRRAQA